MANRNDCQRVLNILETYERILGQQVNRIEAKLPSFSINHFWGYERGNSGGVRSHRVFCDIYLKI